MSEYNEIKITNEYLSRNEYQTAHISASANLIPPTPTLKEPNKIQQVSARPKRKRHLKIAAHVMSAVIAVAGATMVGVSVADELDLLTPIVQVIFAENNAAVQLWESADGVTFSLQVVNYTPLDALSLAVLDKDNACVWVAPFASEQADTQALATQGTVNNLSSDSDYTLCLYEGDKLLWSRAFHTKPAEPVSYLLDNAEVSLQPTENAVYYSIALPEYTVFDHIAVTVTDLNGATVEGQVTVEPDTEEHVVFVYGVAADLSPTTGYTFRLLDGDRLLYESGFETGAPIVVPEPIEAHLSPEVDRVVYYFTFPSSFSPHSGLIARVANEAGAIDQPATLTQDGDLWIVEDYVAELNADTAYTFRLLDGDDVLYEAEFTTEAEAIIVPDVSLSPDVIEVSFTFTLPSAYVQQGEMRVVAQEVADSSNTYEQEVNLADLGNDLWGAEGILTDLSPSTEYTFYIYDGETVLYQSEFTTQAPVQYVTDVVLTPYDNHVDFTFTLSADYTEQAGLMVVVAEVADSENTNENEFSRQENQSGGWDCEGFMSDLTPETDYIFYIYDGEEVVYQDTFTTTAYIDPIASIRLTPSTNSLSFHFEFDPTYTIRDFISIQVYDGDFNESLQVEVTDVNNVRVCEGIIEGLTPSSTYSVYVYDGWDVIYYNEITTEEEPGVIMSAQLTPDVYGVAFAFTVDGSYVVQEGLTVVAENESGLQDSVVSLEEDGEGNWSCSGYLNDLPPAQEYDFYLYDGEEVLYHGVFSTLGASVEMTLTPDSSSVAYTFTVYNSNALDGSLRVEVTDGVDTYESDPTENETGIYTIEGTGSLTDLNPATEYTFTLYDGDSVLWQDTFSTLE